MDNNNTEDVMSITDNDIDSIIRETGLGTNETDLRNDANCHSDFATEEDNCDSMPREMNARAIEECERNLGIVNQYKDEQFLRFRGAEWFEAFRARKVSVIGAGGISSWTAMLLSRLNMAEMNIYDSGNVEVKNMSGQMFTRCDVGKNKAHAVADIVRLFNWDTVSVCGYPNNFLHNRYASYDIVVSGVDSMRSRKDIFNQLKGLDLFYIDGRLSADALQIFAFNMRDKALSERYEREFLFGDDEADETVCSFRQTTYMASMIASLIANIIVNKVNNSVNIVEYVIPFITEYDAMTMRLKTSM